MVQLGLLEDVKRQVLKWDGVTVPMKEPSDFIGQTYITSREMREVSMQTIEPVSIREANEMLVKILGSTYAKSDLEKLAANATHFSAE